METKNEVEVKQKVHTRHCAINGHNIVKFDQEANLLCCKCGLTWDEIREIELDQKSATKP